MRSGEDIEDIISKRGITREEVDALNPDVNLDRLSGMNTTPNQLSGAIYFVRASGGRPQYA